MPGQGPSPMALGAFAFQALGFSFTDVGRKLDTSWATIAVADRLDALQFTGPKSDGVTIRGVLFPEEWGGLSTLEGLRNAALAGVPLMLATRAGKIRGMHVVMGISEDRSIHRADGLPRRDAYSIELKRYTGPLGSLGSLLRLF